MMFKNRLKVGVGLFALMIAASAAFADEMQTVTNDATVDVTSPSSITSTGALGIGASASVSATGAVGSVSVSGINSAFATSTAAGGSTSPIFATFGKVTQDVRNAGGITVTTPQILLGAPGTPSSLGMGATAQISATGVAAAFSVLGVSSGATALDFGSLPTVGITQQTATNTSTGVVALSNGSIAPTTGADPANLGVGASASVGATGAVASFSVGSVSGFANTATVPAFSAGNVTQSVENGATITNTSGAVNVGDLANGASVSVSATGALTSVGLLTLGSGVLSSVDFGNVSQTSTNSAAISNSTETTLQSVGNLAGNSVSVSFSALGASSVFSATMMSVAFYNAASAITLVPTAEGATQTVNNSGAVTNAFTGGSTGGAVGGLVAGEAASLSSSATGANAAIGMTAVESMGVEGIVFSGAATQVVTNNGPVTNTALVTAPSSTLRGDGSSVMSSASGAVAAIGATEVYSAGTATQFMADVAQTATNNNTLNIGNPLAKPQVGDLSGAGSSMSVSAAGATASLGTTTIAATASFQAIQVTGTTTQVVSNTAGLSGQAQITAGELIGDSSSVFIGMTGAVASIAGTNLAGGGQPVSVSVNGSSFGGIVTQNVSNSAAVTNADAFNGTPGSSIISGPLSGNGASVSISSTGAVASISSSTSSSWMDVTSLSFAAGILQTATNTGAVTTGQNGMVASIITGDLSATSASEEYGGRGHGASVSIGGTGALASISSSVVDSMGAFTPLNFTAGSVGQTATNSASVGVYGSISAGTLAGVGTSASISATGAVASLSSTSIFSSMTNAAVSTYAPAVTQTVDNGGTSAAPASAAITNIGAITTGDLVGNGSSVSVGATGAAGSISVSSINDATLTSFAPLGSITQTVTNLAGGAVSNTGTITVASLSANGASASISAAGAAASISYRSVK